ncbi:MAG: hypothetical protein KDD15_09590, partial [Lewinella sp.]|nr:hypothetical protein [Lewinella sp.]
MYSTPDVQYPDQQLESLIQAENDANLWLYNGDVGLVLYHYYRSRYQDDPQALATGLAILEKQIENAGAYLYNFKFAYGVPGLGWLIQFLINQGVLVDEE